MSIYHCSIKTISRSSGRTASGSAAYRSGEKIRDNAGDIHDYTKKQGILFKAIILPDSAPYWASDRTALWNNVDKAETRKNSTVAREYEIALPAELNQDEQAKLSKGFAKYLVNEYGIAADIAIHAPRKDGNNYHAHILTSTRVLGADGFGAKTRILDSAKTGSVEIKKIRAVWEDLVNQFLERNGIDERVSCESLKAQGLDREPQIHLGVATAAMERRGIRTERADHNRQIREHEAKVKAMQREESIKAPIGATVLEPPKAPLRKGQWLMVSLSGKDYPAEVLKYGSGEGILQFHAQKPLTFKLDMLKYRIMSDQEVTEKKLEWEQRDNEQQEKQYQQRSREGMGR